MAVELIYGAWKKIKEEVKEMVVDDGALKGNAVGTCATATEVGFSLLNVEVGTCANAVGTCATATKVRCSSRIEANAEVRTCATAMEVGCSHSIETNGDRNDLFKDDDAAFDALLVESVKETELSLAKDKTAKISFLLNSIQPTQTVGATATALPPVTTTAVACTKAVTAAATSVTVISLGRKQIGLNHNNDHNSNGAVGVIGGGGSISPPSTTTVDAATADLVTPAFIPPAVVSPGRKMVVAGAKSVTNASIACSERETIAEANKSGSKRARKGGK